MGTKEDIVAAIDKAAVLFVQSDSFIQQAYLEYGKAAALFHATFPELSSFGDQTGGGNPGGDRHAMEDKAIDLSTEDDV